MKNILKLFSAVTLMVSLPALAGSFTLTSNDIAQYEKIGKKHESNHGFAHCTGENMSPHLKWSNAPEGTKSFAITMYDLDASRSNGFWHWMLVNIPANVTEIATNAGSSEEDLAPAGSVHQKHDLGGASYLGVCPSKGETNRYRVTVHALSVESLEPFYTAQLGAGVFPKAPSHAVAGAVINMHTIESSSIVAVSVQ